MVKKLWKHELLSYVRLLVPVYVAVFGMAVLARGLQFFEAENVAYEIAFGSSITLSILSMLVSVLLTTIFVIVRFYRNLFSGEGYLTFTLPATPTQHLWVKLTCACVCQLTSLVVIVLAALVLGFGDVNTEVFKAIGYLFNKAYGTVGVHMYWFILEYVVLLLVSLVSTTLVYYTCISIGQTFKKNRVLATVGIYFAYTVIAQVISTILSIAFTVASEFLPFEEWMKAITKNPYPYIHGLVAVVLVISAVLSLMFFLLSRHILRNKLNLE